MLDYRSASTLSAIQNSRLSVRYLFNISACARRRRPSERGVPPRPIAPSHEETSCRPPFTRTWRCRKLRPSIGEVLSGNHWRPYRADERSATTFCCGLPGAMWCRSMPAVLRPGQDCRAGERGAVVRDVLSGLPRRATIASRSNPGAREGGIRCQAEALAGDVVAHGKDAPLLINAFAAESSDQGLLGRCGGSIGLACPKPGDASPAAAPFCSSGQRPRAEAGCGGGESRTGPARRRAPAAAPAVPSRPAAGCVPDRAAVDTVVVHARRWLTSITAQRRRRPSWPLGRWRRPSGCWPHSSRWGSFDVFGQKGL